MEIEYKVSALEQKRVVLINYRLLAHVVESSQPFQSFLLRVQLGRLNCLQAGRSGLLCWLFVEHWRGLLLQHLCFHLGALSSPTGRFCLLDVVDKQQICLPKFEVLYFLTFVLLNPIHDLDFLLLLQTPLPLLSDLRQLRDTVQDTGVDFTEPFDHLFLPTSLLFM